MGRCNGNSHLYTHSEFGERHTLHDVWENWRPVFPLFARMIPPFDESFNQFASDLKTVAEEKA